MPKTPVIHVPWRDYLSRREFLRSSAISAGTAALSVSQVPGFSAGRQGTDVSCILLFLVGGPSQLDTWDLKPSGPSHIRGPFKPIRTNVPGIEICEHFPRLAKMADRFAIVRSVHNKLPAIHEIGQQLMQTGHVCKAGKEHPHYGAVVSNVLGPKVHGLPANVIIPRPIGNTGAKLSHGQGAGILGPMHDPVSIAANVGRGMGAAYGDSDFGRSCLLARELVEQGVRFVTVNMFDTVFDKVTWDCHADGRSLATTLDDYRDTLCPTFDRALAGLLEDLHQRGMLEKTLVVAMGEFGRTPLLNSCGGRDHWPGVWSIIFAGGGIRGGQVIGSSDKYGAEPRDRPVSPAEVAATVFHAMGIDLKMRGPGAQERIPSPINGLPIVELF